MTDRLVYKIELLLLFGLVTPTRRGSTMVSPHPAPVRPHVFAPETNDVVLLEDAIESLLDADTDVTVELIGPAGFGKSTALAHLATLPFAERLVLIDDAWRNDVAVAGIDRVRIYASRLPLDLCDVRYRLASWSMDDVIEYMLATSPDRCSSVVTRLNNDRDLQRLAGNPALVCLVVQQLVANDKMCDVRSALRCAIAEQAPDARDLEELRICAAAMILDQPELAESKSRVLKQRGINQTLMGALNSPFVQLLLCSDYLVSLLKGNADHPFPTHRLPKEVVKEVARIVASDPNALKQLRELFAHGDAAYTPMSASILYAVDHRQWRPLRKGRRNFRGAYFSGADWPSIDLCGCFLREVELRGTRLSDANLSHCDLRDAMFARLRATRLRLTRSCAVGAIFDEADLSCADLADCNFHRAQFASAKIDQAVASNANFEDANLENASLRGAFLDDCDLRGANLRDADFTGATLVNANLTRQILRSTILAAANLTRAKLAGADLEFADCRGACLAYANLAQAYLTGCRMDFADLRSAKLTGAGLADVDWQNADLRSADLRGSTFHMGSSRSGLVDSPYPSHGTRTGFYTNDYEDRSFKAPEEIRKANLCGADLRGANITGVDFYLVDLRGAKYDSHQEAHLRNCDAILENYVP